MWHQRCTKHVMLALFMLQAISFDESLAVFTGTPVLLRWARVEETAALFAINTPNTEIFYEPIQQAAQIALVARMDNSMELANDRAWTPPGLEKRTFYSVAFDYFAKPRAAQNTAASYWIHNPGKLNFVLVDKSPEHVSLKRVFRTATILATASVFTRPRDPLKADRYRREALALLNPVFMSSNSMRPNMTWAAAIPKDSPENADSLQPNPNGFMELNDLPLMLDIVSMLQVDDESLQYLKQWLQFVSCRDYKNWLVTWRGRNIHRFSSEGELSLKMQLAAISHYLGEISEYHGHCYGSEDIFNSWIDLDGHLTTKIRADSPHASTLETLSALTSLALVCAASPTNLLRLPAPAAANTTRPLLALAAKRAADEFAGRYLYLPTDTVWPTRGAPYGLSFYAATETLPALYQAYQQKEVAYFMRSLVAANKEEHRSGRALVSALRHVSPTTPQNLVFLTGTANSGEFSCDAREDLHLPECTAMDFIHTKAGIAVLLVVCIIVAVGLCVAVRWRLNLVDSAVEPPTSPRKAAVAHVTVTLKEKKTKASGDKGNDGNSGSHMGSSGEYSEMQISALPAGASGYHMGKLHPQEWRHSPVRGSDSCMSSSRQSIRGSNMCAAGGSATLGGGSSSFNKASACMPPDVHTLWRNGCKTPMHAFHGMYFNPVAAQMGGIHGPNGAPANQASMQMGYGAGSMMHNGKYQFDPCYLPDMGVHTHGRRSRSRTPPRTQQSQYSSSRSSKLRHKQHNVQSHARLLESLKAFHQVAHSSGDKNSKSGEVSDRRSNTCDLSQECSVDDVPIQPRQGTLQSEASDSAVVRNGSVSFALAAASSTSSYEPIIAVASELGDAACGTHAAHSAAVDTILEEYSKEFDSSTLSPPTRSYQHIGARTGASTIPFSGEQEEGERAPPTASPAKSTRSTASGRDVNASDFEDDASVLSVSSMMVPQHNKVTKSMEGSVLCLTKSGHSSLSVGKVDTLPEVAPSAALLQVHRVPPKSPLYPKRLPRGVALSPEQSPAYVSDLDDAVSCMHMPPPPAAGPSGSSFFTAAIMGDTGQSPQRLGLSSMTPQVLRSLHSASAASEERQQNKGGPVNRSNI